MSDNKSNPVPKQQSIAIPIIIAFAAGFLCGVAATVYKLNAAAPADPHAGHSQMGEMTAALEAEVVKNPDNLQVWVAVGKSIF